MRFYYAQKSSQNLKNIIFAEIHYTIEMLNRVSDSYPLLKKKYTVVNIYSVIKIQNFGIFGPKMKSIALP